MIVTACRRPTRLRRGVAAIAAVLLLLIVNLVIIGMVVGGAPDQNLTVRRVETLQAFYAAEAATQMGIREVTANADEDGDGTIGSVSDDADDDNNPAFGATSFFATASINAGQTTLIGYGSSGDAQRRMEATVEGGGSGNRPGLAVARYIGLVAPESVDDVNWSASPDSTAVVTRIAFSETTDAVAGWPGGPANYFGQRFTGTIDIPQNGNWTFYTESNDGSRLWIDGVLVVDNDGLHVMQTASGTINLPAGTYDLDVRWFQQANNKGLVVSWSGPGVPAQTVIPTSALRH